jgi:hypothetical protein
MLNIIKHLFFTLLLITCSFSVHSESDITLKLGYQTVDGHYSNASIKESISSKGTIINAEYLEDLNITHTSTDTHIKFKALSDIIQTSKFTSVGYNLFSDYGKINRRTDYQTIDNDDVTGATDDVSVNSYQVSILPYDESYYAEVGFSKSNYSYANSVFYTTPLDIKQLNISYAKSVTGRDWLTFKGYKIKSSDILRTHGKGEFNSVELKYKYFLGENALKVDNIELSALSGKRIFAVDSVSGSTYNVGDLQTGSLGLSAEWKLSENANLLLSVSREKYLTSGGIEYEGKYNYINFNYDF